MAFLSVLGIPRDVPTNYPGEFGTFALLRIAPPVDVGEYRCLPQAQFAYWPEVLPPPARVPGERTLYVPPMAADIPAGLDGIRMR